MSRSTRSLLGLVSVLALVAAPAAAVKRRAFVTSVAGTGNLASWVASGGLTGLAAADNVCRVRAVAGGLPNGATYRAWLSTSTTDAYCHVQGLTGKRSNQCNGAPQPGGGPWYLVNGVSYFTGSLAELTGAEGTIHRPVLLDEFADEVASNEQMYWTGTSVIGTGVGTNDCGDWTSASDASFGQQGAALGSAVVWTDRLVARCDASLRLLCLEPGASEAQPRLGWAPGSLAFVTSATGPGDLSTWPQAAGASGLEAADNICRNLAAAAHLPAPESFVAWLSDSLEDAKDRVTSNGPFRRVDAFAVADNKADLVDGSTDNSLHVFEDGRYLTIDEDVWTGTDGDGVLKTPNCFDWTSEANGDLGAIGIAGHARYQAWTEHAFSACHHPRRLYCLSNVTTIFWDGFELTGDASRWTSVAP